MLVRASQKPGGMAPPVQSPICTTFKLPIVCDASTTGSSAPTAKPTTALPLVFGDLFELVGQLTKGAGGAGSTAPAKGAPAAQPIPDPAQTKVVPAATWEHPKTKKSQWKDKTDPDTIKTTTDGSGKVRVVSFDSNLVIDEDGTKKNVVGLKYYEAETKRQRTALQAAHPDWGKAKLDTEAKQAAKEAAVAEAAQKTKDTKEQWTVDIDYRSDIATINGTQLDANKIPFIALPKQIRELSDPPIKHGDLVAVSFKGKTVYAIYGDGGPNWKSGEGSPALAKKLGLGGGYNDAEAAKAGEYVTYTILPGSKSHLGTGALSYDAVQKAGAAAFDQAKKDGVIAP